jgi:hypothetical protein
VTSEITFLGPETNIFFQLLAPRNGPNISIILLVIVFPEVWPIEKEEVIQTCFAFFVSRTGTIQIMERNTSPTAFNSHF